VLLVGILVDKMVKKKRKQKQEFNLIQEYKESWNYIKESKNFIYSIIGIFILFTLIGYFIPAPESIAEKIMQYIEILIQQTEGLGFAGILEFIFVNNFKSVLISLLLGVIFGILPIIGAIANGYLLGFVSFMGVQAEGFSILLRLVPHGIFELPAIFLSMGLGLKFGTFLFQKDVTRAFNKYFWNSLRVFLLVILPLLIVAALIESYFITFGV
jgi:stage II sporulation protein M